MFNCFVLLAGFEYDAVEILSVTHANAAAVAAYRKEESEIMNKRLCSY